MIQKNLANIKNIISEIKSYTDRYSDNDTIPQIEQDILLQKTRTLYDSLLQTESQVETKTEEKTVEENLIQIELPEEECVLSEIDNPLQEETSVSEVIEIEEKPVQPVIEEKPVQPAEQPEEIQTKEEENTPKQQSFAPKQTIDLSSKLAKTPITSILSAMSINDRFLFRSKLFNNDQEKFIKSIDILNDSNDINAAMKYIHSKFNWDFEDEIVLQFISLVERRFL